MSNRLRLFTLFYLSISIVWLIGTTASAESIDGAFKFGVESRLFRFASLTVEDQGPFGGIEETISIIELGLFSFGPAITSSAGIPASSIGVDLAYGLSDNFLLGSRLMVDYGHFKEDADSFSTTQFAIAPHLDYVFTTNSSFRPFIGAQFGAQGNYLSSDSSDIWSYLFMVGCSIGAFAFVYDVLSIDPRISFFYSFGSVDTEDVTGSDPDTSSFTIALMIGFSGWI